MLRHLRLPLQCLLPRGNIAVDGPDTDEDPQLVLPPLGHHIDDAGQLHEEQARVVRHVCLLEEKNTNS